MAAFGSARRLAHLLGRRRKADAPPAEKRAAFPPPQAAPVKSFPTTRPQPKAKKIESLLPPEPRATAAELKAAVAGAMAEMRAGDIYLGSLEQDEAAQAFAEHWEVVAAAVENRPVRERLHRGPPQPATTPMSNEQFGAMWSRVQGVLEGS